MASRFSGAVKLADLDDFLGPAQACVKPLMRPREAQDSDEKKPNRGSTVTIEVDMEMDVAPPARNFPQIKLSSSKKTAVVSLNDCLACSGCVTSAETVLITQQSVKEFYTNLKSGQFVVVVTICPQTRAALAHLHGLTLLQTAKRLTTFFKRRLGVDYVFDSSFALDLALTESRDEFVRRFQERRNVPLFASECPGWICYAEKTQGSAVLPYISTVKSPQQIMGTLVKKRLAERLHINPQQIYHTAVMPCFDKKLEGSRDDFFDTEHMTREVNCVLTTTELVEILQTEHVDLAAEEESLLDPEFNNVSPTQDMLYGAPDTGASGGYAENIFRYAAEVLFNRRIEGELQYVAKRNNPDLRELTLEVDGQPVLQFALAYGFRNIQNIVMKLKRGKCPYHYVEIMACPSGCLNGGGQIKAESKEVRAQRTLIEEVDSVFHQLEQRQVRPPQENPLAQQLRAEWLGPPGSELSRQLLHTQYHAVKDLQGDVQNPLAIRW